MSKKNDDFFKEKKPWSEVKDQLLGCYFKPYVSKILHTYKPLVYVDCFAGKGVFDDGSPGSPIIALDIIKECLSTTTVEKSSVYTYFIDLDHADELKDNLLGYPNTEVISGKYEDNINHVLENKCGSNVFLYIDPYGIKSLRFSMFENFANNQFNSIEMLINMNSFGFIREACNALGSSLKLDDPTIFDDLVEYEPAKLIASSKSITDLNEIAGGEYWQAIIEDYKTGKIDGYQAEEQFSEQYCKRLMTIFNYVLNMPLRIHRGQRPKYRMIHATNHTEGCLLMVDNIYNRWETWRNVQTGGQISFFEEDPNNHVLERPVIKEKAISHFSGYKDWTSLNKAMSLFFVKYGPICKTSVIGDLLREFNKDGLLAVLRNPQLTSKGKPTRFMTENSKQKVLLRWTV